MPTAAAKMIVPAFLMYALTRSQMCSHQLLREGRWYSGSSMRNGAGSPAKGLVFFSMMAETMMESTPRK